VESTFFSTVWVEETSTYSTASDGDLWPAAWSDDDYLYVANGDGKGFDLQAEWADIVVNRVSGHPWEHDIAGIRLASGDDVGQVWSDPQRYNRKPTGMVSVDGTLYLAVQDLRSERGPLIFNDVPCATILKSTDKGRSWSWDRARPMFDQYRFTTITFLDYGQDSRNNVFDNYVYAYGLDHNWRDSFADTVPDPTELCLARVPRDRVQQRSSWEFYAGEEDGTPLWTDAIERKVPVLRDTRRVYTRTVGEVRPRNMSVLSQGSIVYNQPLRRYLYTSWTEYTFEFYEAPAPWGPWKRFLSKDFGIYPWSPARHGGYGVVIPSKYISEDGREMWLNSNTFVGGLQNYNFSFRRLRVTPFRESTPQNSAGDDNLALPAHGQDVTPIARACFHDGNVAFLNNGIRDESEDSRNGEVKSEDFWGYTWSRTYHLNRVVYTTGRIVEAEGGWFDDIRVEVRQNHVWVEVQDLKVDPPYPSDARAGTNTTYTFTFSTTWGDGIRVIGTPGGTAAYTSFAELEVYFSV
jgi:hypothetical protein